MVHINQHFKLDLYKSNHFLFVTEKQTAIASENLFLSSYLRSKYYINNILFINTLCNHYAANILFYLSHNSNL